MTAESVVEWEISLGLEDMVLAIQNAHNTVTQYKPNVQEVDGLFWSSDFELQKTKTKLKKCTGTVFRQLR